MVFVVSKDCGVPLPLIEVSRGIGFRFAVNASIDIPHTLVYPILHPLIAALWTAWVSKSEENVLDLPADRTDEGDAEDDINRIQTDSDRFLFGEVSVVDSEQHKYLPAPKVPQSAITLHITGNVMLGIGKSDFLS